MEIPVSDDSLSPAAPSGQPTRKSLSVADFQQLIRVMYLEKDLARGIEGTFMWLMEEVGELASAPVQRHPGGTGPGVCRRDRLADHDRQRGGHRPECGPGAEIRGGLPRLRAPGLLVSERGETMSGGAGTRRVRWNPFRVQVVAPSAPQGSRGAATLGYVMKPRCGLARIGASCWQRWVPWPPRLPPLPCRIRPRSLPCTWASAITTRPACGRRWS